MIDINAKREVFQTECIHSYKTHENLHLKLKVLSFPAGISLLLRCMYTLLINENKSTCASPEYISIK